MNIYNSIEEVKNIGQINANSLVNADCLEAMKYIADKSIDLILCDLPYEITACEWDTIIPFNKHIKEINNRGKEIILYRDEYILQEVKKGKSYKDTINYFDNNAIDGLWDNYNRIIKDNGAVVLFGSQPFTTKLIQSNLEMFRYEWIFEKHQGTNPAMAKKQPLKAHENILVFYKLQPVYCPQMGKGKPYKGYKSDKPQSEVYGGGKSVHRDNPNGTRYPKTVVKFTKDKGKRFHPTQKPVALLEYLIKTYTNEGETVLDNCMGSGTTGVACKNLNRNFIGIEKDEHYFNVGKKRVEEHIFNGTRLQDND
jgi:site-specific DNA-methyltransferase (adenine-specific)